MYWNGYKYDYDEKNALKIPVGEEKQIFHLLYDHIGHNYMHLIYSNGRIYSADDILSYEEEEHERKYEGPL